MNLQTPPKRDPLTPEEERQLKEFISQAVIGNLVFPPTRMGTQGYTIQDLHHQLTIKSLGEYADFMEAQSSKVSRSQRAQGQEEKRIGNTSVTYKRVAEVIDLLIKAKQYSEYVDQLKAISGQIDTELKSLQTPEERKTELLALKASMASS